MRELGTKWSRRELGTEWSSLSAHLRVAKSKTYWSSKCGM